MTMHPIIDWLTDGSHLPGLPLNLYPSGENEGLGNYPRSECGENPASLSGTEVRRAFL
jgi:hypothetical protein